MANRYVDSNAVGAGTGADWANAYTTLAAALAAVTSGDDVWVAHDHAETAAATKTLTCANTPIRIFCVNKAGSVPPVAADLRTTATVTTTGAFGIVFGSTGAAQAYCYGITFDAGTGATNVGITTTNGVLANWRLVNCRLRKLGTNTNSVSIRLGNNISTNQLFILENTTLAFGSTGDGMDGKLVWRDTPSAVTGATLPTTLFGAPGCFIHCQGVDFSALTGTLVAAGFGTFITFEDCKFHPSATPVAGTNALPNGERHIIRSDSGGAGYRHEKFAYGGNQFVETTIVRSGGASDGSTPIAWKVVNGFGVRPEYAFRSVPIPIWIDGGSPRTITMYGIWGNAFVPTNAEFWLEVAYLGTAGSVLRSTVSSGRATVLDVPSNVSPDASVWGGSSTPFLASVSVSPAQSGYALVTACAARSSATFYLDPKLVLS